MARILVIDDDALIRETLKTMLQLEGHEVVLAPHGEEGVRHFREQALDLVICDTFMPRHGRMETIAAIRSVSPDVPIIAMTAGARDMPEADDRNRGQDLHMPVGATATIASRSGRSSCLD